jgi:hypothetical protein
MIPISAADITLDWLNERTGDEVGTLIAFEAATIGEGVGILGEVSRLSLTYAEGQTGPATLIAKCQSASPENIALCQIMGFYIREVSFYQQFGADAPVRVPKCYLADMEEGGSPFVLLLEEVTGARMIDQIVGATLEDCLAIAGTVAPLHAAFWDNDAVKALEWLPPMNNDLYKGASALYAANRDGFREKWDGRLPEEVMNACDELNPKYAEMLDWWPQHSPACLTHTDCRAENYLFGGSAGDDAVTMLDFQLSTRHVGTWDIANFMGMSVPVEERRLWEQQVVRHYHDTLLASGVTGYDFEQCWRDYRYCQFHQAWSIVVVSDLDPGNYRGRELLDTFAIRGFQAVADNNGHEFLQEL